MKKTLPPPQSHEIEHINDDYTIMPTNSKRRLYVSPGKYLITDSNNQYPIVNGQVKIYQTKQSLLDSDSYYHIYGEELDDNFLGAMGRFYFNIIAKGAIQMIDFLTVRINQLSLPFHLKCFKDLTQYNRSNTAVLFVDKRYLSKLLPELTKLYRLLIKQDYLNPPTPLFTRPLTLGIAFAENPPNRNEGFGTSRCRLIAEAIIQANEKGVKDVTSAVLGHIVSKHYDLDKFYLNPGSRFEYDFSTFDS